MTTEESFSLLPPEDVVEALSLIEAAIASGDVEALRTVWDCWDDRQQRQLWEAMTASFRQDVSRLLSLPRSGAAWKQGNSVPLVPGSVVRWFGRAGKWIVSAVNEAKAMIFRSDAPEHQHQVSTQELTCLPIEHEFS